MVYLMPRLPPRHILVTFPPEQRAHWMSAQRLLFSRRYRAALLDYLLGNGETGLSNAYELGRSAIDEEYGLLRILRTHQRVLNGVLASIHSVDEGLKHVRAAEEFLMETLSPFEMTHRGYVAMLEGDHRQGRASVADVRKARNLPPAS
jgi:hypothetical protein